MEGFLTIGYCSRIIGYCFSSCFIEIFVGEQGSMEGDKVMIRGISPVPLPGKPFFLH